MVPGGWAPEGKKVVLTAHQALTGSTAVATLWGGLICRFTGLAQGHTGGFEAPSLSPEPVFFALVQSERRVGHLWGAG